MSLKVEFPKVNFNVFWIRDTSPYAMIRDMTTKNGIEMDSKVNHNQTAVIEPNRRPGFLHDSRNPSFDCSESPNNSLTDVWVNGKIVDDPILKIIRPVIQYSMMPVQAINPPTQHIDNPQNRRVELLILSFE